MWFGARALPSVDGMSQRHDSERIEAVQAVVDRVSSYQDGAPDSTVESELRKGLDEAGVSLETNELSALAEAIENFPKLLNFL